MGWGSGGGNGGRGWGIARVYREEALEAKVSNMVALTTSLGRQFQSLIALGRKVRAPVLFS